MVKFKIGQKVIIGKKKTEGFVLRKNYSGLYLVTMKGYKVPQNVHMSDMRKA